MNTIETTLPIPKQRLPRSKKTKDWGIAVMKSLDSASQDTAYKGRNSKQRKQVNYNLFNGILNEDDFKYVTDAFGLKGDDMPANFQHYDIISPKISVLIGEEIDRPFNFRVMTVNDDAVSSMEEEQKAMISNVIRDYIMGLEDEESIKRLQDHLKYSYSDMRERNGQHALSYIVKQERLQEKFAEGFKHALIAGEEIYWVGPVEGRPVVRLVNPLDITVILDPNSTNIEDAQAIIEERYMTISSVIDEFHSELSPKDIKYLEGIIGTDTGRFGPDGPLIYSTEGIVIQSGDSYERVSSSTGGNANEGMIRVMSYEWKSMRKVYILSHFDETLKRRVSDVVDETYKIPAHAMKKDGVWYFDEYEAEEHWISEYWTAIQIHDLYLEARPKQNQRRSMDNPSNCKSNYIGKIYNATNSQSTSIVERMKNYNYLYDILFYRLEILISKDKGRIMLMDIAQIPTVEGWDVDKWLYYLQAMNISFINSQEEGKDGNSPGFNQFTDIDLTTGNQIEHYVSLLDMIEQKIGALVGVSQQREGQIQASELVGNVERSVKQSAHITEYWFFLHNECKKQVLEAVLDIARIVWREGRKINYISDDGGRIFLDLDPGEFASCEYGVFVTNSSKDYRAVETLRALAQAALQNDKISMEELGIIMTVDDIATIKHTLKLGEERRMQQQQELIKQQGEQDKALQAQIQEWEMLKIENENMQKELDRQNKIDIELIKLQGNQEGIGITETSNEDTPLDKAKFGLEKKKADRDYEIRMKELKLKQAKLEQDLKLAKEKLVIDRKKAAQRPKTSSKK